MKNFNQNATKLIISLNNGEKWEIDEIPSANINAETIRDSGNSTEVISDDEKYKAVLCVNLAEGNIEIYDNDSDEEITDFDVREIFEEE